MPKNSAEIVPATTPIVLKLAQPPNLDAHLEPLKESLRKILSIPDSQWPDNKQVTVEMELALVPLNLKTTVQKIEQSQPIILDAGEDAKNV